MKTRADQPANPLPNRLAGRFLQVLAVLAVLAVVAAGCSSEADQGQASPGTALDDRTLLGLGDSVFDFHSEDNASIPHIAGQALDRPVLNVAVSGARFANPDPDAAAEGLDIRSQYDNLGQTGFEWVVLDGGGNDVNDGCGCGQCEALQTELISADGTSGQIVDFVTQLVNDGSNVMYVGYYEIPGDAEFGFDRCGDELTEHNRRLALMATQLEGVWFVNATDVVTADNREAYDADRVHPSPQGAQIVGEYVAIAINQAEQ